MSVLGEALARAGAWLIEPAPAEPAVAPAPAPVATILDRGHSATTKQERSPLDRARIGPMELRARPMEPRPRLVACPPAPEPPTLARPELPARPVVAVIALARGCGATTIARALAATLARRDHSGAAIVASTAAPVGSTLSARAAVRLAARIASSGSPATATGRLCLVRPHDLAAFTSSARSMAPLVLDLPPGGGHGAPLAHLTILIAPGDAEPALAELAARSLARGARDPLTVVSSAPGDASWDGRAFTHLPQSRLGARLAAVGWQPRGAFGAAVARLADACEQAACA